jgi:alpha-beta hydrolase superfamily lysophospholipase
MTSTTIAFKNDDGINLSGEIYWPSGRPRAFVLFAHCFTCTRKSKAAVTVARALNRTGFAVLTFDFTGLGQSEGEFADSNFSTNVDDLIAAASFLAAEYAGPSILIGHSLGGTAVLAAAERIVSCRAVATIGAPARAEHVKHLLGEQLEAIEREGVASVHIGERPFTVKRQFIDDVADQAVPENLRNLDAALMIMHSPLDRIVGIDNAAEIFTNAIHPKSFVSLDNADHLLSHRADAEYAADVLASWAARYLDPDDSETKEHGNGRIRD